MQSPLNGPGTRVGRRRDSAPHCTDSIGFLLAALGSGSLALSLSAARVLSPPLSFLSPSLSAPPGAFSLRCNLALFGSSLSLSLSSLLSYPTFSVLYRSVRRASRSRDETKEKEETRRGKSADGEGEGTRARLNIYLNGSAVSERD